MHLVDSDRGRLSERWVTGLDRGGNQVVCRVCIWHSNRPVRLGGHNEYEAASRVIVDEVNGPAELTGKNQSDDQVDVDCLASLQNPN